MNKIDSFTILWILLIIFFYTTWLLFTIYFINNIKNMPKKKNSILVFDKTSDIINYLDDKSETMINYINNNLNSKYTLIRKFITILIYLHIEKDVEMNKN